MKKKKASKKASRKAPKRPYPRRTLEEALNVPTALKDFNGGNDWAPSELASALNQSKGSSTFYYLTAASRDFGFTEGTRDTDYVALTDFGRSVVYAPNRAKEEELLRQAFMNVDLFRRVLEYYKGSALPELKYLSNTLENEFQLDKAVHEEFVEFFRKNTEYLKIGSSYETQKRLSAPGEGSVEFVEQSRSSSPDVVTLGEPTGGSGNHCFVIMPFRERDETHSPGFFDEVLRSIIVPSATGAGFTVTTANREGSDVIQSTIVNNLLDADLVVADLTEHNPNVLFELGMRMAFDKPVALIRAKGTGQIFDVDNMLRVYEYDSSLWPSTVKKDIPHMKSFIRASWKNRGSERTYLKILRHGPAKEIVGSG